MIGIPRTVGALTGSSITMKRRSGASSNGTSLPPALLALAPVLTRDCAGGDLACELYRAESVDAVLLLQCRYACKRDPRIGVLSVHEHGANLLRIHLVPERGYETYPVPRYEPLSPRDYCQTSLLSTSRLPVKASQ